MGARSSTGQSSGLLNRSASGLSSIPHSPYGNEPTELGVLLGALADDITPVSRDLATLIKAWSDLPEAIKAGIMAMVMATTSGNRGSSS